jgi:hypothetical protein
LNRGRERGVYYITEARADLGYQSSVTFAVLLEDLRVSVR